jgi:urea transport system ATP-binding protein
VFKHLTLLENLALSSPTLGPLVDVVWRADRGATGQHGVHSETLGLLEKAHHKAGSLSHGEVQWLEIGMVMAQDPTLLLLDEPVAGMTAANVKTAQLLQRMAQDHAVLIVEATMEFVRRRPKR